MKHLKTRALLPGLAIVLFVAASLIDQRAATRQNTAPKPAAREEAYRANNIGVALLEQYKHKEATCWANWGLLTMRQKNFDPAAERLERARSLAVELVTLDLLTKNE